MNRTLPTVAEPTLIANIKIHSEVIDEWYGITASFDWTPVGLARWQSIKAIQERSATHALVEVVAKEVLASPRAHAFYAKPKTVTALNDGGGGDGGGERRVTLPIFRVDEFSDWNFTDQGGSISASDR